MKIVSITTIKNEADIIESFVRYHLNIVDLMIILDNGSTDDTLNILNQLEKESLPIIVLIDEDKYFEPFVKYNYLLNIALNEHGADVICPLDCDEFITCDIEHPRKIIEEIPENSFYKVKWRTYVPTKNDDESIKFIPSRITNIRDEMIEKDSKIIITKDLVNNFDAKLSIGNHSIDVDEEFENKITCFDNTPLKLAHFPLRSVNQTISKVLVSYPNTLSRKTVAKGTSFHYKNIFDKIKNNINVDVDDITIFAKQYSLDLEGSQSEYKNDDLIELKQHPMNLDSFKNIEIKYSFRENPLENLLNNYIYFAKEINFFRNNIENYENEALLLKEDFQKRWVDVNQKTIVHSKKLAENNLKLKEDNLKLNETITQLTIEKEDLTKRNSILSKSKKDLNDRLNDTVYDLEKLKIENYNQKELIKKLESKSLKNYLKRLFRH